MKNKLLHLVLFVAWSTIFAVTGCTTVEPDVADPTHVVTWSSPISCDGAVDHPCPYLVTTSLVTFNALAADAGLGTHASADRVALTWWGSSADTDRGPVEDLAQYTLPGDVVLAQQGDDAGERRESVLHRTPTGYEGDVVWTLFTVAGDTAFHVSVDRIDALEVGQ